MAIPGFQDLMLPILELLADGRARRVVPEITGTLESRFHLTADEIDQRIPSGLARTFANRTHWAVTYLAQAGLVVRPARGTAEITALGRAALDEKPLRVDVAYLRRYPEFEEFRTRARGKPDDATPSLGDRDERDPEELLYATYDTLRRSIEADLLDRLHDPRFSWVAFERLVVDLLTAMGYGGSTEGNGSRVTRRSGDDGVDGVIDEDRLGLDAVYVQAKKYGPDHAVGRPDLQKFAGSLEGQRASKGVFITTSRFSSEAREYVERISRRIVLLDGAQLARLMYEHDIGVRPRRQLDVKRVDEAFFEGDV
jgi:restriction system protein